MVIFYSKKEFLQVISSKNYVAAILDGNKPQSHIEYRRSYEIKQQKSEEMKTAALRHAE